MLLDDIKPNQPFTLRPIEPPAMTADEDCFIIQSDIPLYVKVESAISRDVELLRHEITGTNRVFIQLVGSVAIDEENDTHIITLLKRRTGYYELVSGDSEVYPYIEPQKAVQQATAQLEQSILPCFKEFLNGLTL